MPSASKALIVGASICLCSASHARSDAHKQAWFYLDSTSKRWCSAVTDASVKAAADSHYDWAETGWLRYHDGVIDSIMIMNQSEDAYEEDTYTFAQDLSVKQVFRKGHYQTDPFLSVTFKSDAHRRLTMTDDSKRTVKKWAYLHYFENWPLYTSLHKMPFAALIRTMPTITVAAHCPEGR